eukprot:Em0090g2a
MEPVKSTSSYYILIGMQVTTLRILQANRSYADYALRSLQANRSYAGSIEDGTCENYFRQPFTQWYAGSIDVVWTLRSLQANRLYAGMQVTPCEAFKQTGRMQVPLKMEPCKNYFQQPFTQWYAGKQVPLKMEPAKTTSSNHLRNGLINSQDKVLLGILPVSREWVDTPWILLGFVANLSSRSIDVVWTLQILQANRLYAGTPCEAFKQTGRKQVPLKMEPAKTTSSNHLRNGMQVPLKMEPAKTTSSNHLRNGGVGIVARKTPTGRLFGTPTSRSGSKGYSSGADATKTRDTACNGLRGRACPLRQCDSRNSTILFVVKDLITAVILGTDFLQLHGLVLDFTTAPSKLSANQESAPPIKPIWTAERLFKTKKCPVASMGGNNGRRKQKSAKSQFGSPPKVEFPEIIKTCFETVIDKFKDLFVTTPGTTSLASQQQAHQYEFHLDEFRCLFWRKLKKKTVILCVDYRELNKKTTKDAYPLPLIDEVQDQLSGSAVFSKLDLRSGYWQLLVDPNNRGSCQLLPAKVMRGLPFVSTYIDDVLIHSTDDEMHAKHLNEVFLRLRKAGLTLRDKKCVIGTPQVTYLGHLFTGSGVTPDREKVKAVEEWPIPENATELLRAYVDQQNEWEKYLPFALYAYRTSTHTSTSVSPFELMFGRQPKDHTEGQTGYAVDEYQGTMQAKLAELMDFVETHMVDAARHQKQEYDKHMGIRTFKAGDLVWLSIPTAGKLDPRWEGGWKVKACKSPVNMEVNDGTRNRVVHVKRLRHRIQMAEGEEVGSTDRTLGEWVPPQTEHITVEGTPPQGPEPDLENNDQPVQPEEPIQRSPSTCGIADWSNHCPRTVGTLHHLRLPRTKGLDVPLWFSTLCHFTFLTAGSVFPSRSFEGRLPPSSLLLKLLHVVFLHLIYALLRLARPPLLFMQARHAARSKGSLHPTKNVAGVQNGFISSRMRPEKTSSKPSKWIEPPPSWRLYRRSSATRCLLRPSWNWNRLQQQSLVGRQVAQVGCRSIKEQNHFWEGNDVGL